MLWAHRFDITLTLLDTEYDPKRVGVVPSTAICRVGKGVLSLPMADRPPNRAMAVIVDGLREAEVKSVDQYYGRWE